MDTKEPAADDVGAEGDQEVSIQQYKELVEKLSEGTSTGEISKPEIVTATMEVAESPEKVKAAVEIFESPKSVQTVMEISESPEVEKVKVSYMSSVKKMVTPKYQKKPVPVKTAPNKPIECIEVSDDEGGNEFSSRSTRTPATTSPTMDAEEEYPTRPYIVELNPTPQYCQPTTYHTTVSTNQYIPNPSYYQSRNYPQKKPEYYDVSSPLHLESYSSGSILTPDKNPNSFQSFGGNDKLLEKLRMLLRPALIPDLSGRLGFTPPRGFLLHGPPGTGKTFLACCIAGELQMNFVKISATELVSGISGNTEQNIRSLFQDTVSYAPSVLLIDEIDAIAGIRDAASKKMEQRAVSQLLVSFDMLNEEMKMMTYPPNVLIIGATNRPEAIDASLRRAGRFDQEICLGMPTRDSRVHMLKVITSSITLSDAVDFNWLADVTPGFVAADLKALIVHSAINRINRLFLNAKKIEELSSDDEDNNDSFAALYRAAHQHRVDPYNIPYQRRIPFRKGPMGGMSSDDFPQNSKRRRLHDPHQMKNTRDENLYPSPPVANDLIVDPCNRTRALKINDLEDFAVEKEDFEVALKQIQPSAKREGFATVPNVKWADVGSLKVAKQQLQLSIMMPVKFRSMCQNLGITSTSGLLLCGPPGCGKTLLAKAVANEANINFISVKGPELLNMYVGESERAVRQCFQRARNSEPCVIFFDEIDALCPKRSPSSDGHTGSRLVNQLLTEMDGVEGGRSGVFLMAATNRPDILDPAILRPGRFDKTIYIGLPTASERVEILSAITKNGTVPTLDSDVNLEVIGKFNCVNFSGADLQALVKEAAVCALNEYINREKSADTNPAIDETVNIIVKNEHFTKALPKIKPSVSLEEIEKYEEFRKYSSFEPQAF